MKYRGFRFDIQNCFWKKIENINTPITIDIHGEYTYSVITLTKDSFDMTKIKSKRLIWGYLHILHP